MQHHPNQRVRHHSVMKLHLKNLKRKRKSSDLSSLLWVSSTSPVLLLFRADSQKVHWELNSVPSGVNISWSWVCNCRSSSMFWALQLPVHISTANIIFCTASGIEFCSLVFFLPNPCLSLFQSCASFLGLDQWSCIWPECANAGLNGAGRSGKTLKFSYFLWRISDIFYIWLLLQLIMALCRVVSWGTQWVFTVFLSFLETFFSNHIS